MNAKKANEAHFFFLCGDLDGRTFEVAEFSGTDRISAPYEFDITLLSTKDDIAADSVINKPSTLFIHRSGEYFPYSGIVSEFQFVNKTTDYCTYRVRLVPRLWLLNLNFQTRVFQKMTVADIIKSVLTTAGVRDLTMNVRSLPQHDLVVQYQESDLNFVCRLMEQEGIWFSFEEFPILPEEMGSVGSEKLVITDNASSFEFISGTSDIMFVGESGMTERIGQDVKESVNALQYEKRMIPQKVTLGNYNYRTPESALSGQSAINQGTVGTIYEYGGNFKNASEAQDAAQVAARRFQSEQVVITGESNCAGFRAGCRFTLEEHARTDLNTNHVLTLVVHSGGHLAGAAASQLTYKNTFRCFPGAQSQNYAPERRAIVPRVNGIITAQIEANGSDYASIDDMGRYKVRFPFDISDNANYDASKYVRLAQPYSGQNYGIHFPSHEGTEMILACIEGDPNKPLGLGTVPNANTLSPVVSVNKHESVIRTAGGNEIILDDTDAKQKIRIKTKGKHVLEQDDENKRIFIQTTDQNKLLLDDKNKQVSWNADKHNITMDYDKQKAIVITTGGGHVIRIDDKEKRITIQTSGGHMIDMDDSGKVITLADGQGKSTVTLDGSKGLILDTKGKISINATQDIDIKGANIKMSASSGKVEIKATQDLNLTGMKVNGKASAGDMKLEGLNVNIKGSMKTAIEGTLGAEFKSTLQTKISGLQTEVAGQAMTTVKGAAVMIN